MKATHFSQEYAGVGFRNKSQLGAIIVLKLRDLIPITTRLEIECSNFPTFSENA